MTIQDIGRIAFTVFASQCICDLLARKFVFNSETYQRLLSSMDRAKTRLHRATPSTTSKSSNSNDKASKKLQRAQDDYKEAASEVAKRHTIPGMLTSFFFLILYRVLSEEYAGKVVAVLPFEPWGWLRKITMRGLPALDDHGAFVGTSSGIPAMDQDAAENAAGAMVASTKACSFLFVYMLCTFTVKFVTHKWVGMPAPGGVDGGVGAILDDPKSQRLLKGFGIDTEEFNEIRKAF